MADDVHLDFETRSRADLPSVGAHRYGVDPSTDVFMAGVSARGSGQPVYLWINPKFQDAGVRSDPEALDLLRQAKRVHAFNAPFEQAICSGTGFDPFIGLNQWRCTQAMARMAGLPDSLEKCGAALNTEAKKNPEGKELIKFFSMPRDDGQFNEPRDHRDKWARFCDYCRTDVRVEKLIDDKLRPRFDLVGENLETFLFTLRMNDAGIPVNVPALRNALTIIDEVSISATEEFRTITGLNITQRQRVLEWLNAYDVDIENMQGETLLALDLSKLQPKVARTITLYNQLSYSAVKKVKVMLDWVCPDGRMRGVFKFYGASTGRWTASGPQIQNVKKPSQKMRPITHAAYHYIANGGCAKGLDAVYGEPVEVLASCIRHFVHADGQELLDGDYNAIEGRIACWSSGQKDILEDWRQNRDLYIRAAAFVFQIPESSIDKKDRKRDFGKVVELAAQFGLGQDGFIRTCDAWGIPCTPELAHRAIYEYYRPTHQEIVKRWYYFDDCMRSAISQPGAMVGPFVVQEICGIKYLLMRLPSGRVIAYPHIEINRRPPTAKEEKEMAAGKHYPDKRFLEITYWGLLAGVNWGRVKLHGALAFQNETQGIAADVMSYGARKAEVNWMAPFALIHDQGLALKQVGQKADDFARALATLPPWANGLPLKVEAKVAPYYSK